MNKEELLYNEIYERTKDFGRTQFVRELMRLQRENKELQQKVNQQLKDNWQRLKEWLETSKIKEFEKTYGKRYGKTFTQAEIIVFNMIKEKMQELDKVGNK